MTDERMPHPAAPSPPVLLADEPVEATVLESERVYEGRVWDVRSDTIGYGDARIVRQYVEHPGAAAIVAVDDEGRVLLIQQYRHPIRRRDWEVPAGLLDIAGETPLETAQRELAEEADLVAESWEPLLSIFTTPGGNDEVVHLFLARGLSPAGEVHAREDEEADIRLEWVPLADVVAGIFAGRLRNGIMTVGVLAAAERLRAAQGVPTP
ncbi:NUDIX domain-containing protein [Microbacterium atlanticum]|uniref:NUDIX domain-containing protein n=1 Tax=Microbacterium atlanticum TaxID=2782168 RepID=UPI001E45A3A3|nr:NUDIX hydrolase [Microbacterium atlanticum]